MPRVLTMSLSFLSAPIRAFFTDFRENKAALDGWRCPTCGSANISKRRKYRKRRCDDCGFEWDHSGGGVGWFGSRLDS